MARFLLERYAAAFDVEALAREAAEAARTGIRHGLEIAHVRTFLAPGDQICFHVFDAPRADTVAEMTRLAGLAHDRMAEVLEAICC